MVRSIYPEALIDLVVGPFAAGSLATADRRLRIHRGLPTLLKRLFACDVAVTGAGQTLLEAAATGTPTAGIELAQNQSGNLSGMQNARAALAAGAIDASGFKDRLARRLEELRDLRTRRRLSAAGRILVDGRGGSRVASALARLAARPAR